MTNSIKVTASTITVTAQGITQDVDPSTFDSAAIDAIFFYGVRRWFQDSVNSQAHQAKGAGVEFDAQAAFAARVALAVSGDINVRGASSVNPMLAWTRKAVRQLARDNDALAAKIKACADTTERNVYIDSVANDNPDIVNPIAESLRDEAAANARKTAQLANAVKL